MVVGVIGVVKEFMDLFNKAKRRFDGLDLLADLSGIALPSLVYLFSFLM